MAEVNKTKVDQELAEVGHSFRNFNREIRILGSLLKQSGHDEDYDLNLKVMRRELIYMQESLSAIITHAKIIDNENVTLKASIQKVTEAAQKNAEEAKAAQSAYTEEEANDTNTEEE
jgi:hypothetical protein